jgi:glycosyltransferase involved in cell wall biosynthesis
MDNSASTIAANSVLLLPDLALENWHSMNVYAAMLRRYLPAVAPQLQYFFPPESELAMPLSTGKVALWQRFWARYRTYPAALQKYDAALVHVLDHSYAHLLRGRQRRRTVINIHDLYPIYLMQEKRSIRTYLRRQLLQWVMAHCQQADQVITISQFTKSEVIQHLGIEAARIQVVYLGVDERFFCPADPLLLADLRQRWQLPDRTILLHIGGCIARKNVEAILAAVVALSATGQAIHFLQVGGKFTQLQQAFIAKMGIAQLITQVNYVTDAELLGVYGLADVLIFPSLYEGFGLPVLEAMAAGVPVVTSNTTALPEAAGQAALLVNPQDVSALTRAIKQILEDSSLRAELQFAGRQQAANFSWQTTAQAVSQIYESLLVI